MTSGKVTGHSRAKSYEVEPALPAKDRRIRQAAHLSAWQRALWPVARWYAHTELPRYGYIMHWWGMNDQPRWAKAPLVEAKERFHGFQVRLDLSDFFQRISYFFGCYHELDVLAAIGACLAPGDAFLDGGANIGLVTLHASGLVGPTGRVDAFEPNPHVFARLCWHVERNALRQVRCHQIGLGETRAEAHVRMPGFDNQAAATLGDIPTRYGEHVKDLGIVRVIPGDEFVAEGGNVPLVIKLDVEGFELHAIRGLRRTIERRLPAIIMEVNGEMLELNGAGPHDIYDVLSPFGYVPWALDRGGFREQHRLKLHPLQREHLAWEKDVLFLARSGVHWRRVEHLFQPPGQYWRHHRLAQMK